MQDLILPRSAREPDPSLPLPFFLFRPQNTDSRGIRCCCNARMEVRVRSDVDLVRVDSKEDRTRRVAGQVSIYAFIM